MSVVVEVLSTFVVEVNADRNILHLMGIASNGRASARALRCDLPNPNQYTVVANRLELNRFDGNDRGIECQSVIRLPRLTPFDAEG